MVDLDFYLQSFGWPWFLGLGFKHGCNIWVLYVVDCFDELIMDIDTILYFVQEKKGNIRIKN